MSPSVRATSGPAAPLYFGPEGARLFGWFHAPAGPPTGPVLTICPPLGFEMIMSHRGLRHLAESAAAAGMPTVRFDYHGTGDSAGSDYDPGRVDAWIASIGHAVDEARRLTGAQDVALLGVRMGALLAGYAASLRTDIAALVAWAPVVSGRTGVRELRAFERLMKSRDPIPGDVPGEPVVAGGFSFTRETVGRLGELDFSRLPRAPAPRALVVPRDDLPDDDKLARVLESLGADVTRAPLRGFEGMMRDAHVTEVPDDAISGIVEWLGSVPATSAVIAVPPAKPVLRGITSVTALLGPNPEHAPVAAIEEHPFRSDDGRLFGVLTRPLGRAGTRRPAIILANAGAVHRIGSNRLYVTAARHWAERGFPVLRLDLGGLGDSAPLAGMAENDVYSARAVGDIREAADVLRRDGEASGIVVAGLSSGGHAAFRAALTLTGIVGMMLINPIVLYPTPGDALDASAQWMNQHKVRWYRERAMHLASWGKLLRGKVDVSDAVQTARRWIRDRTAASLGGLRRTFDRQGATRQDQGDVEQDLAAICARGTDVALLFTRGEPGLDNLGLNDAGTLRRLRSLPNFSFYEIPLEGHSFPTIRAQKMLVELLTQHLQHRFG